MITNIACIPILIYVIITKDYIYIIVYALHKSMILKKAGDLTIGGAIKHGKYEHLLCVRTCVMEKDGGL